MCKNGLPSCIIYNIGMVEKQETNKKTQNTNIAPHTRSVSEGSNTGRTWRKPRGFGRKKTSCLLLSPIVSDCLLVSPHMCVLDGVSAVVRLLSPCLPLSPLYVPVLDGVSAHPCLPCPTVSIRAPVWGVSAFPESCLHVFLCLLLSPHMCACVRRTVRLHTCTCVRCVRLRLPTCVPVLVFAAFLMRPVCFMLNF